MKREDENEEPVFAALERADPVPDYRALEGPDSPAARALVASITGDASGEPASENSKHLLLHESVRVEIHDRVALLRFDDGKVNVLNTEVIHALDEAVQVCEEDHDIGALLIVGRPGHFSAGLDRRIFLASRGVAESPLSSLARLVTRIYASELPVVTACTGNAIAAGALLLLAADVRVAVRGDYKIGLNETAIGLPLPGWAAVLARERLSRRQLQRATLMAQLYPPDEAADAGFVDQVVSQGDLVATAIREAETLAALDPEAYAATIRTTRGQTIARLEALIEEDFGS